MSDGLRERDGESGLSRMTALVLDSDVDVVAALAVAFAQGGFALVATRVDSLEGLRTLHDADFDVVFSECQLDGLTALDLLPRVRVHWPDVPFVVVTHGSTETMAARCIRAGAWDYVVKSDLSGLCGSVREALDAAASLSPPPQVAVAGYRVMVEHGPLSVTLTDEHGLVLHRTGVALLGRSARQRVGHSLFAFCHPDDLAGHEKGLAGIVGRPNAVYRGECRVRHVDGTYRWLESVAINQMHEPGVRAITWLASDITARKAAEAQLALRGEQLQVINQAMQAYLACGLVDRACQGLLDHMVRRTHSDQGFLLIVEKAGLRLQGSSSNAALQGHVGTLVIAPRGLTRQCADEGRSVLCNNVTQDVGSGFEALGHSPARLLMVPVAVGETVVAVLGVMDASSPYDAQDLSAFEMLAHPVAFMHESWRRSQQQVRLERELQHVQKLEAVGRLAGGLAHDFNNVLFAVLGFADMALDTLPSGHAAADYLREIVTAAERSRHLTRQLLAFSRRQPVEPMAFDVNDQLKGMERILRCLIGEDITLELRPASTLGLVQADPGQFEQILMNLAVNARDAMPAGGRLTFETVSVRLDAAHVAAADGQRFICLRAIDTGAGISEHVLPHIFEPFFTTKTGGQGTGLGLSTIYGIVDHLGGHIEVISTLDVGTCFSLYFPELAGPTATATPLITRAPLGAGETILLVEDDDAVREIMITALSREGYIILAASTPQRALQLARANQELHLLLTDIVLPEMNGFVLYETLLRERPDLRVLLVSGYSEFMLRPEGERGRLPFLQKPFRRDALLDRVHRILRDPASVAVAETSHGGHLENESRSSSSESGA